MGHRQIRVVLLSLLFVSLACAAPDASPRYELSIRAGLPLEEALQELARQSGIQLIFFSKITAGRSAPELSGEYTLTAALTRLLEGSDLTFRRVNQHTVEVRQAQPRSARSPPLRAQQSTPASDAPMQEVKVIATAEQLVATRVSTPLQEIPQSILVVSSEQIREQNSFELADVMLNTPGFAVRRTTSLDESAYSRAFQVNSFHVDGGGALKPSFNNWNLYLGGNPDLSEFDRVEVLRGSDALFSGNSNPGGTVSLVRKRPLPTPTFEMSATLGSWSNYRIELDGTGPLTDSGDLRARADVVYSTRHYFFARAYQDRKKVFAVVEYDFTPTSTLTAGGSYQWDDALPLASSVPTYSDGSDAFLPRSTSLSFDWAYYDTRIAEAYLQYRQQFFDDWILKLNTSAERIITNYGYGGFLGSTINKVSHILGPPFASFSTRPNQFTVGAMDATLTGKFNWFGLRERVAIGGDFTRSRGNDDSEDYFPFGPQLTDVATFDPKAYPDPRTIRAPDLAGSGRLVLEEYGGFVSLQADVTKELALTGAVRIATDRFKLDSTASSGGVSLPTALIELNNNHVVQPFGALMYRISDHFSWYASYADIYLAQIVDYLKSGGNPIGPQHGVTVESGIKGAWREGALNGSLAVYRTEQQGVPIFLGAQANLPGCCFRSGAAHSRGVELDLDGELAPGWLIGSGYAYNLYATGTSQFPVTSTPHHLLKIWTSKRLPGAFSRWTIGGSLRAQTTTPGVPSYKCDAQMQNCVLGSNPGTRPYAVLDLRAGFQLDRHWQVALSVNNVLDKRYYLSENTPDVTFWYGDPRNFMLRIDAKY